MKLLSVLCAGFVVISLPTVVSAANDHKTQQLDNQKYQCHLTEQRNSDFCQRVMFPAIPFR